MRRLFAAIRFLTILPLPGGMSDAPNELADATPLFPVVGMLIGGVMAALAIGLWSILPPTVAAVLLVVSMLGVSGGFHMDGLSDSADGFFSSRPKDRILEIMKDSHVGAMGVIAILAVVLLKVAAVASLPEPRVMYVAFLMPLAGRCALVIGVNLLGNARVEGGLGSLFCGRRSLPQIVWALAVLLAAAWIALRWTGLIAAAVTLSVILLFSAHCYRKIGGATGDTLGATCELAETAMVVALAATSVQPLA
ncbi:MAG TPA: adenosylcobinamide-GDP ribazoletransferase [Thermoguttaceae bacterium]|nr:adenosylcobinamide-GDP ribazoletransferase [Thermoguttaceae bacterium]